MTSLKYFICVAVILTSELQSAYGIRHIDKVFILRFHNEFRRWFANNRRAGDMKKLQWSRKLQLQAEARISCDQISTLTNKNKFDPSYNFGVSQNNNPYYVIANWTSEVKTSFLPYYATCLHLDECKHFLTMINSKHHYIGCAVGESCSNDNTTSLLCLYKGGDVIAPAFKIGAPCTKCDGTSSFCEDGLCVPCDKSTSDQCECRKTCKKQNVGYGNLNNTTCTCTCIYGMGENCDEECSNKEQYVDYDVCGTITKEDCAVTGSEEYDYDVGIFKEFCPETCGVCNKYPSTVRDVLKVAD